VKERLLEAFKRGDLVSKSMLEVCSETLLND